MSTDASSVVHDWLAAVNEGEVERAIALTAADVVLVGPRGRAEGLEILRAWLATAGATFETRRTFAGGDTVVVEQHGVWRAPEGDVIGEADVATRFVVRDEAIAELERYDELEDALRAGGLTEVDEAARS